MSHRLLARVLLAAAVAIAPWPEQASLAQSSGKPSASSDLRSRFPGRRVGGGTRGVCTSRFVAHLVPSSSVYAPGSVPVLALLQGPSPEASPLLMEFRPYLPGGLASAGAVPGQQVRLPASEAGITLFNLPPLPGPTVWESSYLCGGDGSGLGGGGGSAGAGSGSLSIVSDGPPPAISLLVKDRSDEDRSAEALLNGLRSSCGQTVNTREVAERFGLADAISDDWPERLPVRCPR